MTLYVNPFRQTDYGDLPSGLEPFGGFVDLEQFGKRESSMGGTVSLSTTPAPGGKSGVSSPFRAKIMNYSENSHDMHACLGNGRGYFHPLGCRAAAL